MIEKVVRKISLYDKRNYDLEYWLTKTPEERLAAIEYLRQQILSDKNESEQRLQRVFRITKLKQS